MPRPFALPDLGEGLTEAEIVKVLVKEGDVIAEDAPLLEVETDKATVEFRSPFGGRVASIHVQPGQTVKVGEVLVTFDDATLAASGRGGGAPLPKPENDDRFRQGRPTSPPRREPAAAGEVNQISTTSTTATAGRGHEPAAAVTRGSGGASRGPAAAGARVGPVPATPATRRLARELGVDLGTVRATGPGGRVTDDDVRAVTGGPERRPLAPAGQAPERGAVAERMTLSATLIPHVTHFDRADVTELDAIIRRNVEPARARGLTLTLTSFLLKAAALALHEHPQFNASLDPAAGELILKRYCHLGVAVATERGLIVPVIRDVDRKPLVELQRELAALAQRVREGKATLDDLRGGTFTITNIGALGGTGAIPIINYPEAAILGVARAREEPVVQEGRIVPRTLLPISLTFDHRVADGADGARFAAAIVRRLERPEQLLLEW